MKAALQMMPTGNSCNPCHKFAGCFGLNVLCVLSHVQFTCRVLSDIMSVAVNCCLHATNTHQRVFKVCLEHPVYTGR